MPFQKVLSIGEHILMVRTSYAHVQTVLVCKVIYRFKVRLLPHFELSLATSILGRSKPGSQYPTEAYGITQTIPASTLHGASAPQ